MIEMVDKEFIRKKVLREGWSIRKTARKLEISRQLVRKCLKDADPPKYQLTVARPSPVLEPFKPIIDQWLAEDEQRPRKQRHTGRRVWERLVEEYGFKGAESTVRRYVGQRRRQQREVYVPLEFSLGSRAFCDWGEAEVILNGEQVTVQLFCMRLAASRDIFVMAFPHQRQEALLSGHRNAFELWGGVPAAITYDNLTTAVRRILEGHNREEQELFASMRAHYLFDSYFATPGRGEEKGTVENLVGYARRNFLVPLPEVRSWDELNAYLRQKCLEYRSRRHPQQHSSVGEVFEREREALQPLPGQPFDCCRHVEVRANQLSLVHFETNRYSVPVAFAHEKLVLKAYVERVEICHGDRVAASHPRLYGRNEESLDLDHYLDLLLHKPGALKYARALRQSPLSATLRQYLKELRERHSRAEREFVQILRLHRQFGGDVLEKAVERALTCQVFSYEGVYNLALQIQQPDVPPPPPLDLSAYRQIPTVQVPSPDLSRFNMLLKRGEGA